MAAPPPAGRPPGAARPGGAPPDNAGAIAPGSRIGRYRVIDRLGTGSMGDVYLGVDESLNRQAALKLLGLKHLHNETVRERFLREARALARLSHPNLITVYESGHIEMPPAGPGPLAFEGGRPYFAMELLEGGDMQKKLDETGRLTSAVVAHVGAQAATGLGEAARAGIIHRDVKPANLGLSRQGVLKVTDFSLAKNLAPEKSLTGKGMVVGTADYIAPEQARGEEVDERADVYALGCTLFHLLTGKPPFRSEEGTEMQRYVDVMRAHLTAKIPDPRRLAPDADDELCRLVARMMDKNREQRPTFDEVAPLLAAVGARLTESKAPAKPVAPPAPDRAAETAPVRAPKPPLPRRPTPLVDAASAPSAEDELRPAGSRRLLPIALAIAAAALAGVGWLLLR